jgi:hypothetical protein
MQPSSAKTIILSQRRDRQTILVEGLLAIPSMFLGTDVFRTPIINLVS